MRRSQKGIFAVGVHQASVNHQVSGTSGRLLLGETNFAVILPKMLREAYGSSSEQQRNQLFEDGRLARRLDLFLNHALPRLVTGVASIPDLSYLHVVRTSTQLPHRYMELLIDAQSRFPHLIIAVDDPQVAAHTLEELVSHALVFATGDWAVAHFHLDDDDLLRSEWVASIARYVSKGFQGCAVSFCLGWAGFFVDGAYVRFQLIEYPNIKLGLSFIGKYCARNQILTLPRYGKGGHTKTHQHLPVITTAQEPMWIYTQHDQNISTLRVKDSEEFRERKINRFAVKSADVPIVGEVQRLMGMPRLPILLT